MSRRNTVNERYAISQAEGLAALKALTSTAVLTFKEDATDVQRYASHGYWDDGPYVSSANRNRSSEAKATSRTSCREPSATVLIPAHNEEATIAGVVQACIASGYPLEDIIVVADSCTDGTARAAAEAGATLVLKTAFADKAAAQNAGLSYVQSDVVVGFDGDTLPQPGCIPLMMAEIANGADATCSTILPLQQHGFFVQGRRFAYALGRRWWRLCQAKVGRIQVLTGASYAFRTDAIRGIGGFPSGLISADMDATWALHRAKKKLTYAASAVALTVEPETFRVYRAQMRRWSSGYFQNLARYKREVLHWRSALVIWTAVFDLLSLFIYEAGFIWSVATGHYLLMKTFAFWLAIHAVITIGLVASVVGIRKALLGWFPYFILNYYNKWLYLCAFTREWILGRHYAAWTGRQGRKTVITPMTRRRKIVLSCIAAIAIASGAVYLGPRSYESRHQSQVVLHVIKPVRTHLIGAVAESLSGFDKAVGIRANLRVLYLNWNDPFPMAKARAAVSLGAEPLIVLSPRHITMRSIAAGQDLVYLRSLAAGIRRLDSPVMLSFAPEANGSWYSWGYHHTPASIYRKAWQQVHNAITPRTSQKVTWLWQMDVTARTSAPYRSLWPGSKYVNEVGIDGHLKTESATFQSTFGKSVKAMRSITGDPLLISEIGIIRSPVRPQQINGIFAALRRDHLAGLVWFDVDFKAWDFRLEGDPESLRVFRTDARAFLR